MKRIAVLLVCLLVSAVSGSAVAGAHASIARAQASIATKVQLRHSNLGFILTTSKGFTLYMFTHDEGAENSCVKIAACAIFWPALTTAEAPVAGLGVKPSLLSTIELEGGVKQVTYAGHALYRYIYDTRRSTGYVGVFAFGGDWDALNPAGEPIT
jgi:predicted lipoprotein with Yx(FWY)xxD motif